jgi:tRNA A37 threonylcarbamoyladenosine dehydratase
MLAGIGIGIGIGTIGFFLTRRRGQTPPVQQLKQHFDKELLDLMKEQLVRNYQFFGEEGQHKIEKSYVIIFGVGGVGSHVVSCLARSGVGRITIVDFDRVTLSSLNRHAFATREHVGRSKVQVFVDFLGRVVPHLRLKVWETYVTPQNVEQFF